MNSEEQYSVDKDLDTIPLAGHLLFTSVTLGSGILILLGAINFAELTDTSQTNVNYNNVLDKHAELDSLAQDCQAEKVNIQTESLSDRLKPLVREYETLREEFMQKSKRYLERQSSVIEDEAFFDVVLRIAEERKASNPCLAPK